VRLSTEKVKELRENFKDNIKNFGENNVVAGSKLIENFLDTIEALQQENEQLRAKLEDWKHEVQCHMDEVIAREKQIEQLRAQVARMREVLEQFKYDYEQNYPIYQNYLAVCQLLREDTVQAYHNPDDVEALRKAREALCKGISELKVHCKYFDNTPEEDACIEMHEAILEIEKALGGVSDGN